MKILGIVIISLLLAVICASAISVQQQVSIEIEEIRANEWISGHVRGLDPKDYPKYKILVYVHTDQWYIHPYAGQDEGLSWASIQEDGEWQIQTVKRQFKADQMAALLVKKNYPEPNKTESLETIQYKARVIRQLRGTPDHGKL